MAGPLTDAQISQWRTKGYVVVSGLLDPALVHNCTQIMDKTFKDKACKDFGSDGKCEFPTSTELDEVTMHEALIDGVCQLLQTQDILLTQADGWCKAGHDDFTAQSNNDQRFHMDYGNNTFLHPPAWHEPEAVAAIVYFADTSVTGGGTAVCARQGEEDELYQPPYIHMPGQAGHYQFHNDRAHAEQYFKDKHPEIAQFREKIYAREEIPDYKPGDVLLYRHDIWHRGTPVKVGHKRSVMNLLWKKRDSFWHLNWQIGWTVWNYYGKTEAVFAALSPKQKALLGVPKPGHEYWSEEKVRWFGARYPDMDIQPYLQALTCGTS